MRRLIAIALCLISPPGPCSGDEIGKRVLKGAEPFRHDPRLAELFEKIDPAKAGWESEVFQDAALKQLHALCELIEAKEQITEEILKPLAAGSAEAKGFDPFSVESDPSFMDHGVSVYRSAIKEDSRTEPLPDALNAGFRLLKGGADTRHSVKIERIVLGDGGKFAETDIRAQFSCRVSEGTRRQYNQRWTAKWVRPYADEPPKLSSVVLTEGTMILPHEGVGKGALPGRLLFGDATVSVLGGNKSFPDQIAWPYDHWRARSDRLMGTDFTSNQGVALADVDGDGLDDVFLSQPGGLPNRLFRHLPDGTAEDVTAAYGLDYLDFTRTGLFVDFDNDGDQDLVIGLSWHLIFLRNDGPKPDGAGMLFKPHFRAACPGMVYALAATDFDNDGDVDVYASGRYAHDSLASERQVLGIPVPYHDANNGGRSTLWRNEGELVFKDVTAEVGLGRNNTRFTLAAAWDDYDNDGDQDLYIANDFGRNNLYRNDAGPQPGERLFTDVAAEAGVEDIGAGMSASWGDYNNDGHMDLYVANMYSSAGHRIASQAEFMKGVDKLTLAAFKRHARGNSLFLNKGDGTFRDTTYEAGVNMGRWAWSSLFTDLNNDGLQDLVVANGFISAEGADDL